MLVTIREERGQFKERCVLVTTREERGQFKERCVLCYYLWGEGTV